MEDQTYIGDGVYASFDGYHIWLKTPAGGPYNEIALEPSVFYALLQFAKGVNDKYAQQVFYVVENAHGQR